MKERTIRTELGDLRITECAADSSTEKTLIYVNGNPLAPQLDQEHQHEWVRAAASELQIDWRKAKYSKQLEGFLVSNHHGARIWIEHPKFAPTPTPPKYVRARAA